MIPICLASGVSLSESAAEAVAGMAKSMDAAQAAVKNFDFIVARIRIEIFRSSKGKMSG